MAQPHDAMSQDEESPVTMEKLPPSATAGGRVHACLTVLTGTAAGQMFRIPEGLSVVGRGSGSQLRIDEEGVSRSHARVRREGASVVVEDAGSRNGTFVNGERIDAPKPLDEGDKIQIGPLTVLRFAHHDEIDERFHQRLVASALRDPLTRLFNKRYLIDRLDCELRFARRHGTSLSILMLDVDHFKSLNDRHGHLAGDAVLAHLATVLQKAVRNEDVVARFGGEELSVVLRSVGIEQAVSLGERLRKLVEGTVIRYRAQELQTTISVGAAGFPWTRVETVDQLVEAAEQALFRAKHDGRNRVSQ